MFSMAQKQAEPKKNCLSVTTRPKRQDHVGWIGLTSIVVSKLSQLFSGEFQQKNCKTEPPIY